MIVPILCAAQNENTSVPPPSAYVAPPSRVYCQQCSRITESEYAQKEKRTTVCFLASFSLNRTPLPHLACKGCKTELFQNQIAPCTGCGVSVPTKCHFCPNCGVAMF